MRKSAQKKMRVRKDKSPSQIPIFNSTKVSGEKNYVDKRKIQTGEPTEPLPERKHKNAFKQR